jgi:hypothetical protein
LTVSSRGAIAVLRIEIEHIEPLIWRRIAVPSSMNLKVLHKVIPAAMGAQNAKAPCSRLL